MIRAGFFVGVIMPETRKYTVVDLFAGVGGLSYGFSRNEHYEIILANEMQKDIAKAKGIASTSKIKLSQLGVLPASAGETPFCCVAAKHS